MIKKTILLIACATVFSVAQAQQSDTGGSSGSWESSGITAPKQTRAQRFDRGLAFDTKTPSMPKGMWVAGMNVGYSQHANDNYNLLIVSGLDSEGHTFDISPMVHYVFANNQSIGLRFSYKRHLLQLDNVGFHLNETLGEMLFGTEGLKYRYQNHTYMGYLSYRYYVGLGAGKRLLIFNEVQAGFGGGQQREDAGQPVNDGERYKRSVFQNSFNFRLGFSPGAVVFITNAVAAEVQIGLLGYEFKKLTQYGTNIESATRKTSRISTKFDFLSIAFGMAFYL